MLWGIINLLLADLKYTSTIIRLLGNHRESISVRFRWNSLGGRKSFDLIHISLYIIFRLQGGQEVIPLFWGQGVISRVFILHNMMHGCWEYVLSCNMNFNLRQLFVADVPMCFFILTHLLQRWRQKLS